MCSDFFCPIASFPRRRESIFRAWSASPVRVNPRVPPARERRTMRFTVSFRYRELQFHNLFL